MSLLGVLGGLGTVDGIATGYGLDGTGIESRWGGIFRTCPDRPWGPPILLYSGYQVSPRSKERPGPDADPSPLLVPWSRKGRAIPLLPLWAVRPVQNLSTCTRVTFTFLFRATFVSLVDVRGTNLSSEITASGARLCFGRTYNLAQIPKRNFCTSPCPMRTSVRTHTC
jgi:hypothetical protein